LSQADFIKLQCKRRQKMFSNWQLGTTVYMSLFHLKSGGRGQQ
jgi:hypothetical protein